MALTMSSFVDKKELNRILLQLVTFASGYFVFMERNV